jgi:hypothetical protein
MKGRSLPSAWIYEKLLLLYPEDLRRDFGGEMALAFADDIEAAWGHGRVTGVILVWWCAVRELLTVALPGQSSNRCVLVPALSFALVASVQCAELWAALHQAARVDTYLLADSIRLIVLLPSVASGFVGFVVTRVYARCSIIALRLD